MCARARARAQSRRTQIAYARRVDEEETRLTNVFCAFRGRRRSSHSRRTFFFLDGGGIFFLAPSDGRRLRVMRADARVRTRHSRCESAPAQRPQLAACFACFCRSRKKKISPSPPPPECSSQFKLLTRVCAPHLHVQKSCSSLVYCDSQRAFSSFERLRIKNFSTEFSLNAVFLSNCARILAVAVAAHDC